jgi:hypothetical protein
VLAVPEHLVGGNPTIALYAQQVPIQDMVIRLAFLANKESIQMEPDLLSVEFALLGLFQRSNLHFVAPAALTLHQT